MVNFLKTSFHIPGLKLGGKVGLVSWILGRLFSSFLTKTDKFIFLFEMQSETVYRPLKKENAFASA